RGVYGVDEKERPSADVIAVQVREVDGADPVGIAPEPLQGAERGGTKIDRERPALVIDQPTGVSTAAGAERIPAAQGRDPHFGVVSRKGASLSPTSPWRRWISRRSASSEAIPPRSESSVSRSSPPRRQRRRNIGSSFSAIGANARWSAASATSVWAMERTALNPSRRMNSADSVHQTSQTHGSFHAGASTAAPS